MQEKHFGVQIRKAMGNLRGSGRKGVYDVWGGALLPYHTPKSQKGDHTPKLSKRGASLGYVPPPRYGVTQLHSSPSKCVYICPQVRGIADRACSNPAYPGWGAQTHFFNHTFTGQSSRTMIT